MEKAMTTVKISPKFQVVIPKELRERMHLRPGTELSVTGHEDHIELAPVRDIRSMRGFMRGINTDVQRDENEEPR